MEIFYQCLVDLHSFILILLKILNSSFSNVKNNIGNINFIIGRSKSNYIKLIKMIFVLLEVVDTYRHSLFLELKELKKCDMTITRLWGPTFLCVGISRCL